MTKNKTKTLRKPMEAATPQARGKKSAAQPQKTAKSPKLDARDWGLKANDPLFQNRDGETHAGKKIRLDKWRSEKSLAENQDPFASQRNDLIKTKRATIAAAEAATTADHVSEILSPTGRAAPCDGNDGEDDEWAENNGAATGEGAQANDNDDDEAERVEGDGSNEVNGASAVGTDHNESNASGTNAAGTDENQRKAHGTTSAAGTNHNESKANGTNAAGTNVHRSFLDIAASMGGGKASMTRGSLPDEKQKNGAMIQVPVLFHAELLKNHITVPADGSFTMASRAAANATGHGIRHIVHRCTEQYTTAAALNATTGYCKQIAKRATCIFLFIHPNPREMPFIFFAHVHPTQQDFKHIHEKVAVICTTLAPTRTISIAPIAGSPLRDGAKEGMTNAHKLQPFRIVSQGSVALHAQNSRAVQTYHNSVRAFDCEVVTGSVNKLKAARQLAMPIDLITTNPHPERTCTVYLNRGCTMPDAFAIAHAIQSFFSESWVIIVEYQVRIVWPAIIVDKAERTRELRAIPFIDTLSKSATYMKTAVLDNINKTKHPIVNIHCDVQHGASAMRIAPTLSAPASESREMILASFRTHAGVPANYAHNMATRLVQQFDSRITVVSSNFRGALCSIPAGAAATDFVGAEANIGNVIVSFFFPNGDTLTHDHNGNIKTSPHMHTGSKGTANVLPGAASPPPPSDVDIIAQRQQERDARQQRAMAEAAAAATMPPAPEPPAPAPARQTPVPAPSAAAAAVVAVREHQAVQDSAASDILRGNVQVVTKKLFPDDDDDDTGKDVPEHVPLTTDGTATVIVADGSIDATAPVIDVDHDAAELSSADTPPASPPVVPVAPAHASPRPSVARTRSQQVWDASHNDVDGNEMAGMCAFTKLMTSPTFDGDDGAAEQFRLASRCSGLRGFNNVDRLHAVDDVTMDTRIQCIASWIAAAELRHPNDRVFLEAFTFWYHAQLTANAVHSATTPLARERYSDGAAAVDMLMRRGGNVARTFRSISGLSDDYTSIRHNSFVVSSVMWADYQCMLQLHVWYHDSADDSSDDHRRNTLDDDSISDDGTLLNIAIHHWFTLLRASNVAARATLTDGAALSVAL
jgi:hypothetical protein